MLATRFPVLKGGTMKRSKLRGTAASLLCVGLLTTGGSAVAQEMRSQQQTQDEYSSSSAPPDQSTSTSTTSSTSTSRSSASKQATLKECVERERAGDSTKSESEARKTCHDALRAERDNPDNEPRPPHQQ
jgi:hypothetical protein